MLKKICALITVIMLMMPVCFAGISSSGGGGRSSSSPSSSSSSRSSAPSSSSISTSKSSTPSSTSSTSLSTTKSSTTPQSTTINTTKSVPIEKGYSGGTMNTTSTNIKNSESRYSPSPNSYGSYAGHSSFGTGLVTGIVAGSLLHPWSVATPVAYGGGYVQAPMGFSIIFAIIDLIILSIIIYVIWRIFFRRKD